MSAIKAATDLCVVFRCQEVKPIYIYVMRVFTICAYSKWISRLQYQKGQDPVTNGQLLHAVEAGNFSGMGRPTQI